MKKSNRRLIALALTVALLISFYVPPIGTAAVNPDAPYVTSTDPSAGASNVALNKTITINLNENTVKGSTFSQIALKDGGATVQATVSYGSYYDSCTGETYVVTSQIVIDPVANLTVDKTYTVVMPDDCVRDLAGNQFEAWHYSFDTNDTVAPTVTGTDPQNGAEGVLENKTITVSFSENITTSTAFGDITVSADGGTPVPATKSISGSTLIIDPDADLAHTKYYYVKIPANAVKDTSLQGNGLQSAYGFHFWTVDRTGPVVTQTNPEANAKNVPLDKTVIVYFDEATVKGNAFNDVVIKDSAGNTIPAVVDYPIYYDTCSGSYLVADNRISIDPTVNLPREETLTVFLPYDCVRDGNGNPIIDWSYSFYTHDTIAPRLETTDPGSGATGVLEGKTITVTFSEEMAAGDKFAHISLKDAAGVSVPVTKTVSGRMLIIDPDADLAHTTKYRVTIPNDAVTDLAGNNYRYGSYGYSFEFTTIDRVIPAVTSTSPADGATQVNVDKTIEVRFNEPTVKGSNFDGIVVRGPTGAEVTATVQYVVYYDSCTGEPYTDGTHLLIDPTANLDPGKTYTVEIPENAIVDGGNNPVPPLTFSFTTDGAGYNYGGILQPINADGSSVFNKGNGRTIPVKFQLTDATGNYVSTAIAKLYLTRVSVVAVGTEVEATSSNPATPGNQFVYDATDNLYIFHLATDDMETGTWQLRIELDDGTSKYVDISLK